MNARNRNKQWLQLLGASLLSAGFLFSQQSLAQEETDESSEAAAEDEVVEEIITTGSRIKRADNSSSPVPMISMGEDQIELTGSINVYDILNELPQAGEGTNRGNTNFTVGSSGLQTINLRGLGSSRTLTLVNGRRWVGGIPGSSIVDLNSIPADLIQRLEVVTGGASSVYGSDAVAGVVNVILKDNYEGIDIEAMGGAYREGDGNTASFSITMGGNYADGRGNAVFNIRADQQGQVRARDRAPYTGIDTLYWGYYYGQAYDEISIPQYSSYPPQGRFFVSGSTGNSEGMLTYDCSQRDEDSVVASNTIVEWAAAGGGTACGFNRTYHRLLEVPLDRYSIFSSTTYDLSENHEMFAELSFTSVDSQSELEPVPFNSEDVFGGDGTRGYNIDNPFVPQEVRDAAIAYHMIDTNDDGVADTLDPSWNQEIPFIRRLQEFGNRGAANTRDTFRVAVGTKGSLGPFDYDWYYQYGVSSRDQTSENYNALNFRSGLNATTDALGNPICADPIAASQGCFPINVFGIGSISSDALSWIDYETLRRSQNTQSVFGANLTGDFDVLGRTISWAAGIENRRETGKDVPDGLAQKGLHGSNVTPATYGEYRVDGIYAEVLIPIVSDVAGFRDLSFETAYRVDDYSTAGRVSASKFGLNWQITDGFRLRAVVAESVRAPSIDDLFSGQAQTYVSIPDPCNGVGSASQATMDPVVVANCLSVPDIAATAASGSFDPDTGQVVPGFVYSQPDLQTISGFVGGNENLLEETADTTTIGLVWTPPYIENFALSLDWYEIEIANVISSVSASRLINECFSSTDFPNVPQCAAHERFPETGKLRYWWSFGINQSLQNTSGYDLSLAYTFDDLWLLPGSLSLKALYTRREQHQFQTTSESEPADSVGEVGFNEDKYKVTLVWQSGDWLVSIDNTMYGKAQDDADYPIDDYKLQAVPFINYVDLQVRYFAGDSMQLYVGVDNLNNQQPSYCPNCKNEPSPGSHYTGGQYRVWDSMFIYGGVKYSFGKD